jgi:hypothetical protein
MATRESMVGVSDITESSGTVSAAGGISSFGIAIEGFFGGGDFGGGVGGGVNYD